MNKKNKKDAETKYREEKDFPQVFSEEKQFLGIEGEKSISGFAISGGGIRSASFGLGVMQAMVANSQLEKIDYMSTVSGGGYLGSALTWALHQDPAAGTTKNDFPLGSRGVADTKENKRLNFIRQHASFLLPDSRVGVVSFGAVILRSIFLSVFVYLSMLVILVALFRKLEFFDFNMHRWGLPDTKIFHGFFLPAAIAMFVLYLAINFLYSFGTFLDSTGTLGNYRAALGWQKLSGWLWKGIIACVVIGSIPLAFKGVKTWIVEMEAGTSSFFGMVVGVWQYFKAQKKESSGGIFSTIAIYLGAFALIYGLLVAAYGISGMKYLHDHQWVFIAIGLTTAVVGFCVSLNQVGPHRVYRDRLMETFLPDENALDENKWGPATKADEALMANMCRAKEDAQPNRNDDEPAKPKCIRPYHIINTNVILVDSPKVKFRGRGGDNFMISPLYCGSSATGWQNTETFQRQMSGITLATAMAASAAALNPNAAVSGAGMTRNSIVSILLSILNLRLGYWAIKPSKETSGVFFPPNFFSPGFWNEVLRQGLTENSANVLLSDGGHFENLALYELLRRKVKFIVLSDGGADPQFNFDDLANAIEKARVDFGVKVSFTDDALNRILKMDGDTVTSFEKKYDIAERGYAVAKITYPDPTKDVDKQEPSGVLVYVKLAMIRELPTDIYSYKGVNPDFPHQSTADQFFDEKQFEAYRELGYNVMWNMMNSEDGEKLFRKNSPDFGSVKDLS